MNNQGLLALAQFILPSEILSNFEVVRVEEDMSLIVISHCLFIFFKFQQIYKFILSFQLVALIIWGFLVFS